MRNGGAAHKNIEAPRICMGRCPRVCGWRVSRLRFPNIDRWVANDKDFSLALEMTIRESDVSQSPSLLVSAPGYQPLGAHLILFPKRIHEFLIDIHAKWCYHVFNRIRKGKCLKGLIGKTGEMPARSRHCNAERIHNVTEKSGRRISEEAESGELLILDHRYDPRAMGRGCLRRCLFAFVQRGFLMGSSVLE